MFNENEQNWNSEENTSHASTSPTDGAQQTYQQPNYQTYTPPIYTPPVKKEKKPLSTGKVVALALCCSLIGGILGAGACLVTQGRTPSDKNHSVIYEGQRETSVIDTATIDTSKIMTPAEVYATNVNSTVGITTSITTNYWGYQTTSAASGSGFVLSEDGYILTNHHVIEGSSAITVTFYDGTSMAAKLIGYDSSNDIAVLKVEATQKLTPVVLGDSTNMNVGDEVIAIGNPLGELTFSLTQGVVSALDRQVTTSSNATMTLMQTDCAINSGNSGGALFNLYGEVIGITNAKYSSSGTEASIDNIGFAIPVNQIKHIVESIIEKGYISKPYIGVRVTNVSEETQRYGLPKGAAVYEVTPDAPAEDAGLQVNDIIVAVDGAEITGSNDLVSVVKNCEVGQVLKLNVYRNGSYLDINLTVGEQVQSATTNENTNNNNNYFFNPFG